MESLRPVPAINVVNTAHAKTDLSNILADSLMPVDATRTNRIVVDA